MSIHRNIIITNTSVYCLVVEYIMYIVKLMFYIRIFCGSSYICHSFSKYQHTEQTTKMSRSLQSLLRALYLHHQPHTSRCLSPDE